MNSIPRAPERAIRSIAFVPPPPTPTALMFAAVVLSGNGNTSPVLLGSGSFAGSIALIRRAGKARRRVRESRSKGGCSVGGESPPTEPVDWLRHYARDVSSSQEVNREGAIE